MEVKFPPSKCRYSPTGSHYYINVDSYLWRCKHCDTTVRLPRNLDSALSLTSFINNYGTQEGYRRWLSANPLILEENHNEH